MSFDSDITVTFDPRPRPGEGWMAEDARAFDDLEAGRRPADASVRWFRWDRPTVTLGRGQSAAGMDRARCAADGVPVVARPTGGRAVLHADEWTYAALVPLDHPALGGTLRDSCRAIVAWVAEALRDAYGVAADGAPLPTAGGGVTGSGLERAACFGRSFGHELTVRGRKLMGSAQRRGRRVLLQQGSLLVGPGQERLARYLALDGGAAERDALERALAAATTTLVAELGARRPDPAAFERAFRALAPAAEAAPVKPG